MFLPQSSGSDFAPPPSGTHLAVCHRIIDLGTQKQEWQGQPKLYRKVLLGWELPDEKMEDGRPFTISQRYTFSSSEKARMRKDLESWRGKKFVEADFGPGGFDIKNVLGKACFLGIIHEEKDGTTYANISSVTALPKGFQAPSATVNETMYFSLDPERFERSAMEKLSPKLQETIRSSPEYAELTNPHPNHSGYEAPPIDHYEGPEEEIPF